MIKQFTIDFAHNSQDRFSGCEIPYQKRAQQKSQVQLLFENVRPSVQAEQAYGNACQAPSSSGK